MASGVCATGLGYVPRLGTVVSDNLLVRMRTPNTLRARCFMCVGICEKCQTNTIIIGPVGMASHRVCVATQHCFVFLVGLVTHDVSACYNT